MSADFYVFGEMAFVPCEFSFWTTVEEFGQCLFFFCLYCFEKCVILRKNKITFCIDIRAKIMDSIGNLFLNHAVHFNCLATGRDLPITNIKWQ